VRTSLKKNLQEEGNKNKKEKRKKIMLHKIYCQLQTRRMKNL